MNKGQRSNKNILSPPLCPLIWRNRRRMEDGHYKFTFTIPQGVTYEVRGIGPEHEVECIRIKE